MSRLSRKVYGLLAQMKQVHRAMQAEAHPFRLAGLASEWLRLFGRCQRILARGQRVRRAA